MARRKKQSPPQTNHSEVQHPLAVEGQPLPWWLTKAGAEKFNRDLAEGRRDAEEWVDGFHRLSPFAQNEAYNLLMSDPSTPFGRVRSFDDMARRGLRAQRDKYKAGPQKKQARVEERHRIIDQLIQQGFNTDEDIFKYLKEHHTGLVKKGRELIGLKDMMKTYRKARKPG